MGKLRLADVEPRGESLGSLIEETTNALYDAARRADMRKGRTHPRDFHITRHAMFVAREMSRVHKIIRSADE